MSQTHPTDADKRRRAAELGARADHLSQRAMEVTTPVYWPDDQGDPETIGSAVLLALGKARLVVTAAHVLDHRHERPLAAVAGGGLIPIGGEISRIYSTTAASPKTDPVDIGVVRLTGDSWGRVPARAFASWADLDDSAAVITRHAFGLVGYPCTKQRNPVSGDQLSAAAYQVVGLEALEATYQAEGVDPQVGLMVGFDKKRTWGPEGRVTAPDLPGVSGAGLWRFGRHVRRATDSARLAGIVIEWHRGRRKYVLATRIRPILAALASRYADVDEFIHRHVEGGA